MKRDFYFFGIFFIGLYIIGALFHSFIFSQVEYQMYNLQSFGNWLLVLISITLIGSIFMLKYFHYKGYQFSFVAGWIAIIAGFVQNILFYIILEFLLRELQSYYVASIIFAMGTGSLFAISLVFSKAGKNSWLKLMGIYIFILLGFFLYLLFVSLDILPVQSANTLIRLNVWISLAYSLQYVPLIMIFYSELKAETESPQSYRYSDSLTALGAIVVLLILVFGFNIGTQGYWSTHISPSTKAIAEPFEASIYVNSEGDTLLYRLLKPLNYNPDIQYPLVVCLHGGAGWGTDNYRQFEGALFARMLSTSVNREKYPAFVLVPQCPPGTSWGGLPNLPKVDALVFETINAVMDRYAIDENRLYVAGHSLGGYGVWYFIGTRPEKFAAAIPVAGEGDPDLAFKMQQVSIWAFHGANDRNVPVNGSRDVIEAIRKVGGDPLYTESPYGGHSWGIVEDTPEVLDWLFAQKRGEKH